MDVDVVARLQRLEVRQRWLLAGVLALGLVCVAQAMGWFPRTGAEVGEFQELRADRIVVGREPGWRMTLDPRGLLVREGDEHRDAQQLVLSASTGIVLSGNERSTWIRPGEVNLIGKVGGSLELQLGGRKGVGPWITFLNDGAQTDIGPGFAAVTGKAGVTSIDGREALGMRVVDRAEEARQGPR